MPPPPRAPRKEHRKTPNDQPDQAERQFTPKRDKPGLAARGAALDILRLVRKGRSLEDALAICRTFDALDGADRAFARELATTVLRRQGSLDEVIETYLNQPLKPAQTELRAILRLAAAQVLVLDVAAHAAASTAVDLSRERRETAGYSKLVNAIARRLPETGKDRLAKVHHRADTPGWLWRRWERAYGPDTARAIADIHRRTPPLDMTIKPGEDLAVWEELLLAKTIGPKSVRRHGGGRIEELPGFDDGTWWVQDVAATLPALLLGDVKGKSVFDLCAAPGGKTMQLAAGGASVLAVDISPTRAERLRENLSRTGLRAGVLIADLMDWEPKDKADAILLDAPCTATGTVRRNPDLLWTKSENEVDKLADLQGRMIDRALTFLNPGGTLVFATCSLLPEEGELAAKKALERNKNLSRIPVTEDEVGGLPVINRDGDIRCLPCHLAEEGGMDGFFAARFRLDS